MNSDCVLCGRPYAECGDCGNFTYCEACDSCAVCAQPFEEAASEEPEE